ncbi:2OG-Fe(II)-dependent halogenase WelO5 family protein [Streptomyces sp. 7N604]|uniref:2OG-Fe(II)-dependent halogenase WelO5 family protein n=1 Tax=Streptomyces sp. 7N604 TaxID=3457415 RepID=UPI003FCF8CB3
MRTLPEPVIDDPTFAASSVEEAGARRALQQLAAGTSGAVRWPGLLADDLPELVKRVHAPSFEPYDEERLDPPIMKFGPAVFDYYVNGRLHEEYWARAEHARKAWRANFGDADPTRAVLARLDRELGIPVRPATIDGRPLYVGILREFPTGSKIHFDEVAREFPGRLDEEPIVQLAFNCHITVPDSGGELTVWRHRWVPDDDVRKDGYGWEPGVVSRVPSVTVRAGGGEGVFFDCRNFHQVAKSYGARRITLSFFMGFTLNGELLVWS